MKTKSEVQLQLLKEIDEICSNNGLHYVLVGFNSLNAFKNHTISKGSRITAVGMTHGDIDRFCEIVEKQYSENRYVEGIFNNSRYNSFNVAYGDKNTIDFHVINLTREKNHGINILIYPIRKSVENIQYKLLAYEQKLRRFLNKRIENDNYRMIRFALSAGNALYSLTGGGKRYNFQLKRLTAIDTWQDIQNYDLLRVGNKEVSSKFFKKVEMHEVDGIDLPFPSPIKDYFIETYGIDYDEKEITPSTQRIRDIVDTEFGFEEILDETSDILKEARSIHEDIVWERKKFQNERDTFDDVWRLVKMTDDQIIYTKYFEKNYDSLIKYDLDDPKQFDKLNKRLGPILDSLRKYSRHGMTYSISPEADALIEKVLIKNDEKDLVKEMKEISKKEYFVE